MRTRQCTRYLCDFCNKGMFKRPSMEKHEAICFHNPTRRCWACDFDGTHTTTPMAELIAALETGGMKALRAAAHHCPACIVATMIQQRKTDPAGNRLDDAEWQERTDFKYKNEMDHFCAAVRESRPEDFL